jgi:uncharacterized protein (TIGR02284 family)
MKMPSGISLDRETTKLVQDLISTNIDSQRGLQEAAEHCDELSVRSMFQDLSTQRYQNAMELEDVVATTGEKPVESGTITGAAHRTWMNLRSAFGGGTGAMLDEAEKGEDHIRDQYRTAATKCPNGPLRDLINRQLTSIEQSHDRVRQLRDEFRKD